MKFTFKKTIPRGPFEIIPHDYWQDWKWQLKNSLKSQEDFSEVYNLSEEERTGFKNSKGIFQIRTTPYYACIGDASRSDDPIRLMQTPSFREMSFQYQEMLDPLGEEANEATKRLIHRYSDRVLFLVTDFCSVYCRFCTRKRFTGKSQAFVGSEDYQSSLEYIRAHTGIREVILSGGDALTLDDERLEQVLSDLREIEHIEIIRIGSRMPVVNPFRITNKLVSIIKKNQPVYFMNHFNHPNEVSYDASVALARLADAGIPLMNQMVFLNGINNHPALVQALSRRLLYLRVKPYYMFQCDPSRGTDHLRTSIDDSLSIQRELWGHLSGLAMPNFSIDIPNGGGKVSMTPNFVVSRHENVWSMKGFDGVAHDYIDPRPEAIRKPQGIDEYVEEWESLRRAKGPAQRQP